jgi:glutamyl-tRNA reductase
MKIFVLGLNHKSAPLAVLEKMTFDSEQVLWALRRLKSRFEGAEFVLLSTCNRVELYCACNRANPVVVDNLVKYLSEFHHIPSEEFQEYLYIHSDEDAVRHLLKVASSLACTAKSTGKVLNRLFHCAFTTGKKIHTTTSIAQGRVSVAGVAVDLVRKLFIDISSAKVVVIGAGEMGELLVRHLLKIGCSDINVINRSYDRAVALAKRYNVTARKWEDLQEQLKEADIIIASAAVKDYLYTKKSFIKIMNERQKQTVLIIDIAVPRNFEPSVNEIDNVHLYSIDDLSEVAGQNRKAREKDITAGMKIIHEDVYAFMDWLGANEIGPLIGQLEEKFIRISQYEMERFFVGVRQEAPCREILEMMVNRIVNKLMHCVIKNVDTVTRENGPTEAAKLVNRIVRQAEAITSESGPKKDVHS